MPERNPVQRLTAEERARALRDAQTIEERLTGWADDAARTHVATMGGSTVFLYLTLMVFGTRIVTELRAIAGSPPGREGRSEVASKRGRDADWPVREVSLVGAPNVAAVVRRG